MSGHYLRPLFAGLGIFAAVYVFEAGLASAGVHGRGTLVYGALLGTFVGLALYCYLRELAAERELRRRRYHENLISHLNHHIRNALQLILNRAELEVHSARELGDIRNAVNRIDWALREILPRVTSGGLPNPPENPIVTCVQLTQARPRPCPGVYPLYVLEKEILSQDDGGPGPSGANKLAQSSVPRDKSA